MQRKLLSIIIILTGIGLLVYPWLAEQYDNYQQQQLTRVWQQNLVGLEDNYANPQQQGTSQDVETRAKKLREDATKSETYIKKNMDGMLKIEKINLNLPILKGATEKNLKISVASMIGKAGAIGNYAIAGHRNQTYGRNFNRLDEVAVGDRIDVDVGQNSFTYIVTEKLYVKPEEVWVLDSNNGHKEITLVTCHPMIKPTHRLVIKGKLKEKEY